MHQGFIKLHRKVKEHWLFAEKRTFSKFEAWIDLLMKASHKDNKFLLGNELQEVKRGQFITSIRKLCDEWNWSNTKVTKFLKLLEQDEMITYKSDTKKTVINVCNYNVYHDYNNDKNDTKTSQKHHDNDTKAHNQECKRMSKNVKEEIPYTDIINYLNEKADKKFKPSANKARDLIKARWNEGHRLEDFKQVIDVCCQKWKGQIFSNGQQGDRYLQPSTLFNGKFDERLNWSIEKSKPEAPTKTKEQLEHEEMVKEMGLFND